MIRPVHLQDIETVYAIYTDETVNPYMSYPAMDRQSFASVFDELMHQDEFLAYEADGKLLGFCTLSKGRGRTTHKVLIHSLGLSGSHQGQGLGTKFMEALLQRLKAEGYKRVELIVESDNEKAIVFYKKMGFCIEGTLRSYFNRETRNVLIDDYFMAMVWNEGEVNG